VTAPNVAPKRLGPYEVGPKIGGGGMAVVYVGRRVDGSGEAVAIKVIKDDLADDSRYVHMFLDEAKILSRLSHPDIIETREFGVQDESRFIAMELLLGRSLMDVFDRCTGQQTRMPIDLAAWVALRVARALEYAHGLEDEQGHRLHVIHRDVNPTNVFLTYDGRVKLIDFGLAKSVGRLAKSGEGIVKGKVPYLAPEQIDDKPFDHRIDLYALGATLWEMTTGRRLFKRANDLETLRAIREQEIVDPSTFVEGLYPDALWQIVRRALARDPADRFPSAGAMADELEAFLSKYGRKEAMPEALARWIEELFPDEAEKQCAWLARVSAVRTPSSQTMRPAAPVAQVDEGIKAEAEAEAETEAEAEAEERHPVRALLALAATIGFLFALAWIFGRC